MDIVIGTPASITTPAAGTVTLFIDSTNNNILSYMDETRAVFIYSQNDPGMEACCACEITKEMSDKLMCAVTKGLISATEFQAIINIGIKVTATESIVDGVKTCSVAITNAAGSVGG